MRIFSNNIRKVRVVRVNYTTGIAETKWADDATGESGPQIQIPHPYMGQSGEGIYVGMQPNTILAVGMLASEVWIPVSVISPNIYGKDPSYISESSIDNILPPSLQKGTILINGLKGSFVKLDGSGNITINNSFGEGLFFSNQDTPSNRCSIKSSSPVEYVVSSSGVKAEGLVKRDLTTSANEVFLALNEPSSEKYLELIGWDPSKDAALDTSNESNRTPALVEERQIILEYGRDWQVGTYDEELARINSAHIDSSDSVHNDVVVQSGGRRERRHNVLSLSLTYPNELIEKTSGTLVDLFGNILDINKNIIPHPIGSKSEDLLNNVFENMRHSVAYHMAINTRKGWGYREEYKVNDKIVSPGFIAPGFIKNDPNPMIFSNNAKDRSKWEINVDKEGLTTINIPSTSETGNVPRLTRYETSSVLGVDKEGIVNDTPRTIKESKGIYRNAKNQDIFVEQIGPGGISVLGNDIVNRAKDKTTSWVEDETAPKTMIEVIEAGTAFHDIRKTANLVLNKDLNRKAYTMTTPQKPVFVPDVIPDPDAISSEISVAVPDFNDPALFQKIHVSEDITITTSNGIINVKQDGVVEVAEITLFQFWGTSEEKIYTYDIAVNKYGIKGVDEKDNDRNATIMTFLKANQIFLTPLDPLKFPIPLPGDMVSVNYFYKGKLPNAGGRSVVMSLDGSLETSIGANTVDRVSWTLDTAGAIVARLGRDRNGRSAMIHADGYVAIEIGGWDYIGESGDDTVDTRFVGQNVPRLNSLVKDPYRFRSGRLVIRIRRADPAKAGSPDPDGDDHLLIIDDSGITVQSAGRLNFISESDITLEAKNSNINLNAENIIAYQNSGMPRYIRRKLNAI